MNAEDIKKLIDEGKPLAETAVREFQATQTIWLVFALIGAAAALGVVILGTVWFRRRDECEEWVLGAILCWTFGLCGLFGALAGAAACYAKLLYPTYHMLKDLL